MTPEQALELLDAMTARAPGTRGDHAAVQQAISVLRAVLMSSGGDD